ncbi:MAG TPA: calcium/proton exchanger [Vicinamibacterales bacterium]|nr:calcium/proton exchanger [Vicinamibacterales bacterium]
MSVIARAAQSWKWILLAFAPVAFAGKFAHLGPVPLFIVSALAVIPLAALIGESTGHLSMHVGRSAGALINATFGNLAELIIATFAVRAGLLEVVKASLTGSILGNLLFVGGLSMLVGGWKRDSQKFNRLSSEASAGQMVVAVAALLLPALFFRAGGGESHPELMHEVSVGTAIVLLITYGCGLLFTLRTHQHLLSDAEHAADHGHDGGWSRNRAIGTLVGVSIVMAVVAEILVDTVGEVGHQWGLNEVFLGVVVLAMIGNAAENSAAVRFAHRNQMDLSIKIVTQASVQIALFVTPLLVLLSFPLGHPLDLQFSLFEIVSVVLAVGIVAYLILNGESNWFEGVQLLALYTMIAVAIYFLP